MKNVLLLLGSIAGSYLHKNTITSSLLQMNEQSLIFYNDAQLKNLFVLLRCYLCFEQQDKTTIQSIFEQQSAILSTSSEEESNQLTYDLVFSIVQNDFLAL